jgi:predicted Rossmann-fold nucleotide-binding protein
MQTGKVYRFPIILYHTPFWQHLLDYMKNTMVEFRVIDREDIELMKHANAPEEVVQIVLREAKDKLKLLKKEDPLNPLVEKLDKILRDA